MIHLAVGHIVEALNSYIDVRTGVADMVVQTYLVEQNGNQNTKAKDKIVLSLVNVEEDRIARSPDTMRRQEDGSYHRVQPEVTVNLYLIFVANLSDYSEALKSLSYVIAYFQQKNYFDYSEIEDLEGVTGKLVAELYTMTFEQVNHLWGALGAKYMPSVMYRVRVATIQEALVEAEIPPISDVHMRGTGTD